MRFKVVNLSLGISCKLSLDMLFRWFEMRRFLVPLLLSVFSFLSYANNFLLQCMKFVAYETVDYLYIYNKLLVLELLFAFIFSTNFI